MRPGDNLAILSIEQSSVENSRFLYQGSFPRFVFSPGTPPDSDNQLLLKAFKAKEKQRYANEKAQFERSHNLNASAAKDSHHGHPHDPHSQGTRPLTSSGRSCSAGTCSPPLGTAPPRHAHRRGCGGPAGELPTPPTTDKLISILARTQRLEHRLPSLHGARVLVVGARLGGAVDFAAAQSRLVPLHQPYAGGSPAEPLLHEQAKRSTPLAWLQAGDGA